MAAVTHARGTGDSGAARCGATSGFMGGIVTCPNCLSLLLPQQQHPNERGLPRGLAVAL